MAVNERILKRQIERLKSLSRGEDRPWGTDRDPGLRDEYLRVLRNASEDDGHAMRIIDSVMDSMKFAPAPAELLAFAKAAARAQEEPYEMRPTRCLKCGDSGFRQVVRVIKGQSYEAAEPCECRQIQEHERIRTVA